MADSSQRREPQVFTRDDGEEVLYLAVSLKPRATEAELEERRLTQALRENRRERTLKLARRLTQGLREVSRSAQFREAFGVAIKELPDHVRNRVLIPFCWKYQEDGGDEYSSHHPETDSDAEETDYTTAEDEENQQQQAQQQPTTEDADGQQQSQPRQQQPQLSPQRQQEIEAVRQLPGPPGVRNEEAPLQPVRPPKDRQREVVDARPLNQ